MKITHCLIKLISLCLALLIFVPSTMALDIDAPPVENTPQSSIQKPKVVNQVDDAMVNRVANNESTLTAPVTDPNFNVMRKKEMLNGKAVFLVVGLLLVASVVPYVTWLALRPR